MVVLQLDTFLYFERFGKILLVTLYKKFIK